MPAHMPFALLLPRDAGPLPRGRRRILPKFRARGFCGGPFSLMLASLIQAHPAPAAEGGAPLSRTLWQPVLDCGAVPPPASISTLNPFVNYSHLGTDYGFHGTAGDQLVWKDGRISADLGGREGWAGMWCSLAGLAKYPDECLDFAAPEAWPVVRDGQPRITRLAVEAQGRGAVKLGIKGPGEEPLWEHQFLVLDDASKWLEAPVNPAAVGRAKFLVWTAQPGSRLSIRKLQLGLEAAPAGMDDFALRVSFAKLARCYTPGTGLVRDRAHLPHGAFDSIPATGLFALAAAAVSSPEIGLVRQADARRILHEVEEALAEIAKGRGLLPHFVQQAIDGRHWIHPGTEFSTVDTAIAYQSLLLAAAILHEDELKARVLAAIRQIEFGKLMLPDGSISHGLKDDCATVLPFGWRDWGGESALVMLLRAIADPAAPAPAMAKTGRPWQGCGFLVEIQSLLHPDFDQPVPDAISGVNWLEARRNHLAEQKHYWASRQPASVAARLGLYGLSAGEALSGTSYQVNGVELPGQDSLQPHYLLMSAALEPNPLEVHTALRHLMDHGWLAPWGSVESFSADGRRYLPMIGALNAGFESLGAYHFRVRSRGQRNAVHEASRSIPEIRTAMRIFYPARH